MNYNLDYFIAKFEAIPDELWCIKERHFGKQHCAHGWCSLNHRYISVEEEAFIEIAENCGILYEGESLRGFAHINNGNHPDYQQPTPKQRILAALYDIKKLQQPTIETIQQFKEVTFEKIKETINIKQSVN